MFRTGETGAACGKSTTDREKDSHVTRVALLALVAHHLEPIAVRAQLG